jgi:ribosomal-protein-serine acetyltransferase
MLDEELPLETGFPGPVTLRKLTLADADAFARHVKRDEEHLAEHLPWPHAATTPEGAEEWIARYESGEDGRLFVAGAWHDGELVGGSLLLHYDEPRANVEIGCWAVSEAEGKGVATAACLALIEIARRDLGVERIEWRSTTVNTRSRRLAEKLGFVHEGTLRSDYVIRGQRYGSDLFSLVGEEIDQAVARG